MIVNVYVSWERGIEQTYNVSVRSPLQVYRWYDGDTCFESIVNGCLILRLGAEYLDSVARLALPSVSTPFPDYRTNSASSTSAIRWHSPTGSLVKTLTTVVR